MKSIIIIIAIFLVTLTAKADWVTKNGLEQIQLPDSNFFFTKVNDSCTKMLLVSQKNLKLYIVDLISGRLEREQKIPYNFDICDYDFELESFVFYEYMYLFGEPIRGPKSPQGKATIFKLLKTDSIEQFDDYYKYLATYVCYREVTSIFIFNHVLYANVVACQTGGKDYYKYYTQFIYENLEAKQIKRYNNKVEGFVLFQQNILIDNSGIKYIQNANGIYNIESNFIKALDIQKNYFSYKTDSATIKYTEVSTGKPLNVVTRDNSGMNDSNHINFITQIKNYKLIEKMSKALFFKNNDTMYVLDNYKGLIIDTLNFANGKLYFNDTSKYFYSIKGSAVYRINLSTYFTPSDIQDFAERKYIFKQDADGIYCQLEGEGEVALYDNVGRLVRTYQIENERYIRKEDLERGVYFLSIQTNGNVYHEKVLVE